MNKPLIYYTLSIYFACYSLILLKINNIVGTLFLCVFLMVMFTTLNFRYFILVVLFFLIGCFSFNIYYNVKPKDSILVRVIENKRWYSLGDYKGRKIILKGNILNLKCGDRILVSGRFINKKDYIKGIIGEYNISKYVKSKEDLLKKIYNFKNRLYYTYSKKIGEDKGALIMACCYGDTKYLSFNSKDDINRLGISHIISVSGYHMALVYKIFEYFLGVKLALIMSFIYVIFTGSRASVIRAYIMIFILKLSKTVYKNYDSLSALSVSGMILLLIRPYYVVDIGFNLSFLATLGILLFNKKLQRILYKFPKKINEALSITLSAQIFSMPYAMCTLQNISIFFILGNLILVPLYSIVIFLGNLAVIVFKINIIFNFITFILNLVITSIKGGSYILLKITPLMIEYNYFYGVLMLIIIMFFIFIKKNFRYLKYFPMVLVSFIIIYNMI